MLKPLYTSILFCMLACQTFAQTASAQPVILSGTVADKAANIPLAYVSVGILNKPLGTVTDTTGHFSFSIGQENVTDTLQLSIVGYAPVKLAVKDFMAGGDKTIALSLKPQQLAEVTVTGSGQWVNTEILGRNTVSTLVQLSVHNKKTVAETVGSEIGMRYNTGNKKALLTDFNFYISANNFNFIKFRVNIYAVKNAMPDTLLVNRQIFATLNDFKTGWIK